MPRRLTSIISVAQRQSSLSKFLHKSKSESRKFLFNRSKRIVELILRSHHFRLEQSKRRNQKEGNIYIIS